MGHRWFCRRGSPGILGKSARGFASEQQEQERVERGKEKEVHGSSDRSRANEIFSCCWAPWQQSLAAWHAWLWQALAAAFGADANAVGYVPRTVQPFWCP